MYRKGQQMNAIRLYETKVLGLTKAATKGNANEAADMALLNTLPQHEQDQLWSFTKLAGHHMNLIMMERFHSDLSTDPDMNRKMVEQGDFVWVPSAWPHDSRSANVLDLTCVHTTLGGQEVKLRPAFVAKVSHSFCTVNLCFTFRGQGIKDNQRELFVPLRDARSHPPGQAVPINALLTHSYPNPQGAYLKLVPEMISWTSPMAPFNSQKSSLDPDSEVVLHEMTKAMQKQELDKRQHGMFYRGLGKIFRGVQAKIQDVQDRILPEDLFWYPIPSNLLTVIVTC